MKNFYRLIKATENIVIYIDSDFHLIVMYPNVTVETEIIISTPPTDGWRMGRPNFKELSELDFYEELVL